MTALHFLPALDAGALAWIAAVAAAVGGMALHVLHPPRDPAVAEAILSASVHP